MLTRVLEPEVMDTAEDARDYDAMDHAQVNRVFVEDFLRLGECTSALDVGTGTAQIPIELCRRHPRIVVEAIDASWAMIELARQNVARANLTERIALGMVEAKTLPYADGTWPATLSNSIIHHIPEPRGVLAEMARVTAAHGILFVRDLLRPANDEDVHAVVNRYAADCNAHQQKLFDDSLRAALSLAEIRALIANIGCDPESVRQTSDRHWTWIRTTPGAAA